MNKNILDIPKIQKTIHKKHKDFIDSVGEMPVKLSADQDFVLARVSSKISTVLDVFIAEKIVDKVLVCEDNRYRGFNISKSGFIKSVYIWTDGEDIILKDSNLSIKHGALEPRLRTIKIGDFDEYNFCNFATELLTYIHEIIYDSRGSMEAKIFNS